MVLFDSSLWIEILRKRGNESLKSEMEEVIKQERIVICGIVKIEVLQGVREKKEFKKLKKIFEGFPELTFDKESADIACEIAWKMRRRGNPQPLSDIIISAICLRYGLELWHLDYHFEEIAKIFPIKQRNLKEVRDEMG